MKAWCEQCGRYVDYSQEATHTEEIEIKGVKFNVQQSYGICPVCGEEVLSNELSDINTHKAHSAYRRALGSITAEEIKAILNKYDIGAQPLSLLLGWGANTIERQMKHTIPDREHAARLHSLMDPRKMFELLQSGRERISSVAYEKALHATKTYLPQSTSTAFVHGNPSRPAESVLKSINWSYLSTVKAVYQAVYSCSCSANPFYRQAFHR